MAPAWESVSQSARVESQSIEKEHAGSKLRVAEAGSWRRGQFENPEEGESPQLEAATKQHSKDSDCKY
jgi:hypothetical protein